MTLCKPQLMGILNVTPDSFSDQGIYFEYDKALAHAIQMAKDGADIIDIGGESTRPNAEPVAEDEEIRRVIPIIEALRNEVTLPLSIDTSKPRVAAAALQAGAKIINDVTGFQNQAMQEIAATFAVDICVMHMHGNPKTMQQNPEYPEGIIDHLLAWFERRTKELIKAGIKEKNIIIDPGIGFGKTVADNFKIVHNLSRFKSLGFRLLLGVSRKSFMGKSINKPPKELLSSTLAINTIAILDEVDIIRVHDVSEHRDIINLLGKYKLIST